MQKLIIILCLLPLSLWGEFAEFNLTDGRSLYAKIIKANDEEVVLERKDGLTFTLKLEAFVKEDNLRIRKWRIEQLLASGKIFELAGKAVTSDLKEQREDGLIIKTWSSHYTIQVKNPNTLDLKNLTLSYTFTVKRDIIAKPIKAGSSDEPESYEGKFVIEIIAAGETLDFATDKIMLKSTELEEGWNWPGGDNQPIVDTMDPLTAKLTFRDQTVAELSVLPVTPSKQQADDEKSPLAKDAK